MVMRKVIPLAVAVLGLCQASNVAAKDSRAQKLHDIAQHHNWDGGTAQLFEIIADERCSLATALLVYWRGKPHYYRQYGSREEVVEYERPVYDLLQKIERGVAEEAFAPRGLAYDPRRDPSLGDLTRDDYAELPRKTLLPDHMWIRATKKGSERIRPSADLILRAQVLSIELAPLERSRLNYVVHTRVIEVLRGSLAQKRFSFRIHSPAKSGLEKKQRIRIEALQHQAGYRVDPYQFRR